MHKIELGLVPIYLEDCVSDYHDYNTWGENKFSVTLVQNKTGRYSGYHKGVLAQNILKQGLKNLSTTCFKRPPKQPYLDLNNNKK